MVHYLINKTIQCATYTYHHVQNLNTPGVISATVIDSNINCHPKCQLSDSQNQDDKIDVIRPHSRDMPFELEKLCLLRDDVEDGVLLIVFNVY